MVLTNEQLMGVIKDMFTGDLSDEQITSLENITDTINEYEDKTKEDWKSKYEESEKTWKKKYTDRFFQGDSADDTKFKPPSDNDDDDDEETEAMKRAKTIRIDDLFK